MRFATLAFPYSTLFYGHQLAAALLFLAFGLLMRARASGAPPGTGRLAAVGALLGAAIAVEYPSVLAAAVIAIVRGGVRAALAPARLGRRRRRARRWPASSLPRRRVRLAAHAALCVLHRHARAGRGRFFGFGRPRGRVLLRAAVLVLSRPVLLRALAAARAAGSGAAVARPDGSAPRRRSRAPSPLLYLAAQRRAQRLARRLGHGSAAPGAGAALPGAGCRRARRRTHAQACRALGLRRAGRRCPRP